MLFSLSGYYILQLFKNKINPNSLSRYKLLNVVSCVQQCDTATGAIVLILIISLMVAIVYGILKPQTQ